jgi:hypothetical protein
MGGRCCGLWSVVAWRSARKLWYPLAIAVRSLTPGLLWQSAGKWLQSIAARYLAFLTDQLPDYVRSTSLCTRCALARLLRGK